MPKWGLRATLPLLAVLTGACAAPSHPAAPVAAGSAALGAATGWGELGAGAGEQPSKEPAKPAAATEAEQDAELAKKLANPIASLISVPIQSNWDYDIGPAHVRDYVAKIQPVIPFSIGKDWNLITRTIVPVIWEESPTDKNDTKWGLGDTVQSFFFSPKEPFKGWVWGAGPAFQWPTSTSDELGNGKTGAGPTFVVLKQDAGGWTHGLLANHIWSFAGQDNTPDVNATFVQPFLVYTTKMHTSYALNTESTYDWENREWTIPLNATVSQLLRIGGIPVQFQIGYRYYTHTPIGGPDWGLRFGVTLLFR